MLGSRQSYNYEVLKLYDLFISPTRAHCSRLAISLSRLGQSRIYFLSIVILIECNGFRKRVAETAESRTCLYSMPRAQDSL